MEKYHDYKELSTSQPTTSARSDGFLNTICDVEWYLCSNNKYPYAFGVSAGGHLLVVFGIFITAIVYDSAEKYTAPQNYNSRGIGGEHE